MNRFFFLALLFFAFLFCLSPVFGKVLLKPTGGPSTPLVAKKLTAATTIDGQFASTVLTLVYANQSPDEIEAEFMYELPPNAVPTYFAYWYGEEKVVARVAEKERAAAIYEHITTRMRDPALVEMIGERTLRAKIFPVMPNSDLKVEIHFVQALPSAADGSTSFTLPIYDADAKALEAIQVDVRVANREEIKWVVNNFGLPVARPDDDYLVSFAGSNYRPQKDLIVRVRRKVAALQASIIDAPSGGRDGFFALALTAANSLQHPRVLITGVSTYDVFSTMPKTIKAHEAFYVFGRYHGSGAGMVTLTGDGYSQKASILFGAKRVEGNVAMSLWAAKRMASLSKNAKNRRAVISLSKRFGMPSKFTSWIAIPQEEMEAYRQEKAGAEAEAYAEQLAQLIVRGRGNTRAGKRLRRMLNASSKIAGCDPGELLHSSLEGRIYDVSHQLAKLIAEKEEKSIRARQLRKELNLLTKYDGKKSKDTISAAMNDIVYTVADDWARIVSEEGEDSVKARFVLKRLHSFASLTGQNVKSQTDYALWNYMVASAVRFESEKIIPEIDKGHLTRLRQQIARLAERYHFDTDAFIADMKEHNWWGLDSETSAQYVFEMSKDKPDAKRVAALRESFTKIVLGGEPMNDYMQMRLERLEARAYARRYERQIVKLRADNQPVPENIKTQAEQYRTRERELRVRMGDPLISVEASGDARQVVAVLPSGEVKQLAYNANSQRWEGRFDVPGYAKSGEYAINIFVVLKDGTRKCEVMTYQVDITPPTGTASAEVVTDPSPVVRLRVAASEDTSRVTAVLPWGERCALIATGKAGEFFALAQVPAEYQGRAFTVSFILTDKAHNRATLTTDAGAR